MKKLFATILMIVAGMASADVVNAVEQKPKLEGLFGIKFGERLPQGAAVVNVSGMALSSYEPKKKFLSFSEYTKYVTPISNQVYRIRAVAPVIPSAGAKLVKMVVKMLEVRFGETAEVKNDCYVLTFAGDDFIRVSHESGRVIIDAVNSKLLAAADSELKADNEMRLADKVSEYEKDIKCLQLITLITKSTTNATVVVKSVFGKKFGDLLLDSDKPERISDNSWRAKLKNAGKGVSEAFGSAKSKRIFRLSYYREGMRVKDDFMAMCQAVEKLLGVTLEQRKGDYCCRLIGDVFVSLSWNDANNRITLDFTDIKLYNQHSDELKEVSSKFWEHIDAL